MEFLKSQLLCAMPKFNISTLLTLKYPPQSQYNTRVCHTIGGVVLF